MRNLADFFGEDVDRGSHRALELVGEAEQGGAAFLLPFLLGDRLLAAQRLGLLHLLAELVEGAGEAADLGATVVDLDDGVAVAFAQLFQRGHRAVQRTGDGAADEITDAEAEREAGTTQAEEEGGAGSAGRRVGKEWVRTCRSRGSQYNI